MGAEEGSQMGKSCARFKKLGVLALDVIGKAIALTPVDDCIRRYEETRKSRYSDPFH